MYGCIVEMTKRSHKLGLTLKTSDAVSVPCELLGQDLDSNIPYEFSILGAINLTRAAATN